MSMTWEGLPSDGYNIAQEAISIEAAEVGREFNRGVDELVELLDVILCAGAALVCGAAAITAIAFAASVVSEWWRGQ